MPARRRTITCDPVGQMEIADRLGVRHKTVNVWQLRGVLPERRWTISGRPAWDWSDIEEWAARTGRLPEERAR